MERMMKVITIQTGSFNEGYENCSIFQLETLNAPIHNKEVCDNTYEHGYETGLSNKPFYCEYDCFSFSYMDYEKGYFKGQEKFNEKQTSSN
jgi:hypothetical protein